MSNRVRDLSKAKGASAEAVVYDEIHRAIAERRLLPGAKLTEEALVDVFKVSRARVRKVLLLLAKENVVKLERNRGAFVWRPTVAEAVNVLEARRVAELEIARKAAIRANAANLKRLKKIVEDEQRALETGDRELIMRLSGEFHIAVAEVANNPILTDFLRALISRCYLILATYQKHDHGTCPQDDHARIVRALEAHDGDGAAAAMAEHFVHIEDELDIRESRVPGQSMREVFRATDAA